MDAVPILLVIELGDLRLSSASSLADMGWFLAGLLILGGLSAFVLWWNRRGRRDPFV